MTRTTPMSSIIICKSVAHGNTHRIAEAIAEVIGSEIAPPRIVEPQNIDPSEVARHDLVGFGSGIYHRRHHKDLRELIATLAPSPERAGSKAFVFASSGLPDSGLTRYLQPLGPRLTAKGYEVLGEFSCRGLDTWGPFGLIGGVNKAHPNTADLAAARAFAEGLLE